VDIGIVGAGRAGSVVGAALLQGGHRVVGVTARSTASRERAARLLPGVPVLDLPDLVRQAEVLILGVPDDAIATVAGQLGARAGQYVVHLSGAHGLSVLAGAAPATPVALHPPMTLTGSALDVERLPGIAFTATAPDMARGTVGALVKSIGAGLQWVAEDRRAAYHAGVVHGSNYLVVLVEQASEVLRGAGVDDPEATLRPLMTALLDNALRDGPAALTGPISRGDVETVRAHLAVLPDHVRPTYVALARATVGLAESSGRLDAGTADRLRLVLSDRRGADTGD
jgi:predicted short-subunit dehydrogenase-like oxidoreductase (DUF2520 family)